jgi:hypothetical protein
VQCAATAYDLPFNNKIGPIWLLSVLQEQG